MSTLSKRLQSVEDRIAIQQHRDLQRQFSGTVALLQAGCGAARGASRAKECGNDRFGLHARGVSRMEA